VDRCRTDPVTKSLDQSKALCCQKLHPAVDGRHSYLQSLKAEVKKSMSLIDFYVKGVTIIQELDEIKLHLPLSIGKSSLKRPI